MIVAEQTICSNALAHILWAALIIYHANWVNVAEIKD